VPLRGQPTVDAFDYAFGDRIRYMTFFLAHLDANHTGFILNQFAKCLPTHPPQLTQFLDPIMTFERAHFSVDQHSL
jgi:hypothetical protein